MVISQGPDGSRASVDEDRQPHSDELEQMTTSAAEVDSAGRSCLIILVLATIALLLLCLWIGVRSTGAGQ